MAGRSRRLSASRDAAMRPSATRLFVRSWPALVFGCAALMAGLWSAPTWSDGPAPRLVAQVVTTWPVSEGPRWALSGPEDGPGGGSDSGGSDSGGGSVATGPKKSSSDGSSGGGGDAPEPAAKSDRPGDSPSDGGSGGGSGEPAPAVSGDRPDSSPAEGDGAAGGSAPPAATEARPRAEDGSGDSGAAPAVSGGPGKAPDSGPATAAAAPPPAPAAEPEQTTVAGSVPAKPGQAGPGDPSGTVPENLKTLFAPTGRPGDPDADASGAAGRPELPAMTLLGQGNDGRTGQAFYQHVVGTDGVAAGRLRSMDTEQLQQLAAQGPPRTAESVLDIATGTRPAQPGTLAEWERQQRIQEWFADSRDRPADFEAFAGALPPTERAKLDQAFAENKPGDLSKPGGLSYWGRKATAVLRDYDAWAARENPSEFIPGSWPDRIERSGNRFVENIPEGLATSLDHLLIQDETTGSNPFTPIVPLIGESMEHAEQRLHPFSQDLKAAGQAYADDLGPIFTDGDWSKLGKHFYDDPVGAAASYLPLGVGAGKLAGGLGKVDQALVDAARAKLGREPGAPPPAAVPGAAAEVPRADPALASGATDSGSPDKSPPPGTAIPEARASGGAETSAAGDSAAAAGGARPPQHGAPTDSAQLATGTGSTMPESRAPGGTVADGDSAIKALERNDIPAAKRFLAPRPAEDLDTANPVAPRGSVTPEFLEPDASATAAGERAIEALKRGDNAALAEALAPRPVTPATNADLAGHLDEILPPHRGMSVDELGLSAAEREALPDALLDDGNFIYFENSGHGFVRRTDPLDTTTMRYRPDGERRPLSEPQTAIGSTLKNHPEVASVLDGLMADRAAHPLDLTRRLGSPSESKRTLDLIEGLADGQVLRGRDLAEYLRDNPGRGPLFEPVPSSTNFDSLGRNRKNTYISDAKTLDPARTVGPNPSAGERQLIDDYAERLSDRVEPAVSEEIASVAERFDGARFAIRTKSTDGLIDKVQRMTSGSAGRAPRPDYQVGDVIDAVGARITARDTAQLEQLLQEVNDHFKTGDNGRILELENMYAQPKPHAPNYRVVPMVIRTKVDGVPYTFELQLNTERAGTAADLGHNTIYKPYVPLDPRETSKIQSMLDEAAALDQNETRLRHGVDGPNR